MKMVDIVRLCPRLFMSRMTKAFTMVYVVSLYKKGLRGAIKAKHQNLAEKYNCDVT